MLLLTAINGATSE